MTEYSAFKVGNFVSPLTAATTNSLLQDADPALHAVLAFYQAIVATHLGARFNAEVVKAGLPTLSGKMTTLAVPYDPLPHLLQAQLVPPMLALYVATERFAEKTALRYHSDEQWKLLYVLPPLTPAQYLQLYPFLRAVNKVIVDRTELGRDPTYLSDAPIWAASGIEEIRIEETRYGTIQGLDSALYFPALEMDLTVFERKMTTPGLTTITSFGGNVKVADDAGSTTVAEFEEDLT